MADWLPAIADGRIRPLVDRVFAFEQLGAAKSHMESNQHLGKIVLRIALLRLKRHYDEVNGGKAPLIG